MTIDNTVVKFITKFKPSCVHLALAENNMHLLSKFKLDFHSDIGNILSKIALATMNESVTQTVRELCELMCYTYITRSIVQLVINNNFVDKHICLI